jgi:GNAT superfamily N-acetyltransferase
MVAGEFTLEKFTPRFLDTLVLSALGFGHPPDNDMIKATKEIIAATADNSYRAVTASGETAAQLLCRIHPIPDGRQVLFAYGELVRPDYQGHHLGSLLLSHALDQTDCELLGLNTQSPVMYAAAENVVDALYPKLDGSPLPPDILAVYRALYPKGNFPVNPGVYHGHALYTAMPDHPLADDFYGFPGFHPEQGDALACIGVVRQPDSAP